MSEPIDNEMNNKKLEEPNDYKARIIDLNEECLTEILKFMDLEDLVRLSKIHSRFHPAIRSVLRTTETVIYSSRVNLKALKIFLQTFGDEIRSLTLFGGPLSNTQEFIEYLLIDFCGNVKKCTFDTKPSLKFVQNIKWFDSLEVLEFRSKSFSRDMVVKSTKLTTLKVVGEAVMDSFWEIVSSIKSDGIVSLIIKQTDFGAQGLTVFHGVKHLSLKCASWPNSPLDHFPNIESFTAECSNNESIAPLMDSISNLKFLKRLRLDLLFVDVDKQTIDLLVGRLPANFDFLHLNLQNGEMSDEAMQRIEKMTDLKFFELTTKQPFNTNLLKIAHSIKQLSVLNKISATTDLDKCMVYIFVELATNLQTMKINFVNLNDVDIDAFYDEMAKIREKQNNKYTLSVTLNTLRPGRQNFIQKGKWVKIFIF